MVNVGRALFVCFSYFYQGQKILSQKLSHPYSPKPPTPPLFSAKFSHILPARTGLLAYFKPPGSLGKCHFFGLYGWKKEREIGVEKGCWVVN